jgi:hypothetical protein
MKKQLYILAIIATAAFVFASCKKDNGGDNEIKNITLNETINAGSTYTLDLSKYGDADDLVSITKQAIDFSVSEITKNLQLGVYSFSKSGSPKTGGNGSETVVIKIYEPAGRRHYDETNITINFTIL